MVGVGFADPDGHPPDERLQQLVLADVTFSSNSANVPLPVDKGMATLSTGLFLIIPLPKLSESSEPVYRIGFNVPIASGPPPSNPSTSYLQQYIDEQGPIFLSSDSSVNPNPIQISKTIWATRFRTHAAIADNFLIRMNPASADQRKPVVLLVGDAAHIHSPAGGLGMNLGIRDAIALGPVLVAHFNSHKDDPTGNDTILEEYASTRRNRALATIRLTKRIMSTVGVFAGWTRLHWLLKLIAGIPFVRSTIAWNLSGLGNR